MRCVPFPLFTGATGVTFGMVAAASYTILVFSDNGLRVQVPSAASTGVVDVTVTTPGGTSAATPADQFTYLAPPIPVVTGISSPSGSVVGGSAGNDTVTLIGSGFTAATAVAFGGTPAASSTIQVYSDNALRVQVPSAAAAGTVDVTVTTPGGTSATSAADQFTYRAAPQPVVGGLSPTSGLVAGGSWVYVLGSGFTGASGVSFGSVAADPHSLAVYSDNELRVTGPAASAAGTVDVTVTTPGGTSATASADQFTYVTSASSGGGPPTITALGPTSGSTVGGYTGYYDVYLIGSGFTGASAVSFGSTPATYFSVFSDSSLYALVPSASAAGTVAIKVTTAAGSSAATSADQFTYVVPPAPAVAGISLGSGSIVGGYTGNYSVQVVGSGFTGATAVSFGGTPATSFSVHADGFLTATAPSASAAGAVDLRVTTPGGTSATTSGDQFTYVIPPAPVVTGISLASGSILGQTGNDTH